MSYAIHARDPSVEAAVRRVAREEAESALSQISADGPLGPRVHAMRKSVKKLRGLLRLVRPVLKEARRENAVLRDAGQGLSSLRDAAVMLSVVQGLADGIDETRRGALLAPFLEAAGHQDARAAEAALPGFRQAMEGVLARSQEWHLSRDGWAALGPGLATTWDAARAAMKAARRDPSADAMHEWRKRAKDHWYQARLLAPIWPAMMDPHVSAADDLGELLGQVNDLAVLDAHLDGADLDDALRDEVRALARTRHTELTARAVPLGRRLFAGDAEGLFDRWQAWWDRRGDQA